MTKREVFTAGAYKFSYKQYDVVNDFKDEPFKGRTYEKDFAQELLAVGMVIYPIITTLWEGKEYIADGRRRLLHARRIVTMPEDEFKDLLSLDSNVKQADFRFISAKMFYDIHPDDNATWGIILNEERKDNLIFAWLQVKELQKAGKWDDIVKMHKLNKARFEKFAQLDKLKEPTKWVDAFMAGKVTETTMIAVSKLGGRQDFVAEILEKKGKVTGADVATAKTVSVAAAINNAPMVGVPVKFEQRVSENLFVVLDPITKDLAYIDTGEHTTTDFGKALERKRELSNGYELYRLVKV